MTINITAHGLNPHFTGFRHEGVEGNAQPYTRRLE
jgi:hypothetical protein